MFNVHFVWTQIIGLVGFICWFFSVSWIFGRLWPKLVTLWGIPEGDVKRIFCGFKHQGDCGALDPSWLKRLFCLEQFEADAEARVHPNKFWLYSDLIGPFKHPSSEKKTRVWKLRAGHERTLYASEHLKLCLYLCSLRWVCVYKYAYKVCLFVCVA